MVIVALQVIAYVRWRQGYKPAFWYLAAWMVMVIGALIYAMAAFGYLGDYPAREVMMQAIVGGQVILLNYAWCNAGACLTRNCWMSNTRPGRNWN